MSKVSPFNDDNTSNTINLAIASLSSSNDANQSTDSNSKTGVASTLPFPKDGIRLSSIKDFYDACGGKDNLKGLTTTDVNDKYQKPMTASSGLSYCEYLKQQNSTNVGQAVVFISHGTTTTTIPISRSLLISINQSLILLTQLQ